MIELSKYNNLTNSYPKIIPNKKIKLIPKEHQNVDVYAMMKLENEGKILFSSKAIIDDDEIIDEAYIDKQYNYTFMHCANKLLEIKNEKKNMLKDMHFTIETNYGILADKVGGGKTITTFCLITQNQIPPSHEKILTSSLMTVTKYTDNIDAIKTNLIIVPHSLSFQWKKAATYFDLKTLTITRRLQVANLTHDKNQTDDAISCIYDYDVIIISATMFEYFYEKFKYIKWARTVIDEITSIKLPLMWEFNTNFIWFLTATPNNIKDVQVRCISSLFKGVSIHTLENMLTKSNDNFVDDAMKLPNYNPIIVQCLTPNALKIVQDYVGGEVIDMLNAGDVQGAINKINCGIDTSDNILSTLTKKFKKELETNEKELNDEKAKILRLNKKEQIKYHNEKITKIEHQIKEITEKCTDLEKRVKAFSQDNCPICLNPFDPAVLTACCKNLFCLKCITICGNLCPLCRKELHLDQCIVIKDKEENKKEDNNELCSKETSLLRILNKNPNGKFLIFSNYDKTFENIIKLLKTNNITNNKLIGTSNIINSTIHKFNDGYIKVLMLNASNYGSGLNLQMATDVIIYHELDSGLETQVIGRAQRLGRTNPLNVYYLLNDNEVCKNKDATTISIYNNDSSALDKLINSLDQFNKLTNINLGPICDSDNDTGEFKQQKKERKQIKKICIKKVNVRRQKKEIDENPQPNKTQQIQDILNGKIVLKEKNKTIEQIINELLDADDQI